MMHARYVLLLKFILPTYILEHFELKSAQEKDNKVLDIELKEFNIVQAEIGQGKYYTKGFYSKCIQEFPLREHLVFFI